MGGTSPGASEMAMSSKKTDGVAWCFQPGCPGRLGFKNTKLQGKQSGCQVAGFCRSFRFFDSFFLSFQKVISHRVASNCRSLGSKQKNHTAFLDSCWRSELH